jgi:hypothetical protein
MRIHSSSSPTGASLTIERDCRSICVVAIGTCPRYFPISSNERMITPVASIRSATSPSMRSNLLVIRSAEVILVPFCRLLCDGLFFLAAFLHSSVQYLRNCSFTNSFPHSSQVKSRIYGASTPLHGLSRLGTPVLVMPVLGMLGLVFSLVSTLRSQMPCLALEIERTYLAAVGSVFPTMLPFHVWNGLLRGLLVIVSLFRAIIIHLWLIFLSSEPLSSSSHSSMSSARSCILLHVPCTAPSPWAVCPCGQVGHRTNLQPSWPWSVRICSTSLSSMPHWGRHSPCSRLPGLPALTGLFLVWRAFHLRATHRNSANPAAKPKPIST